MAAKEKTQKELLEEVNKGIGFVQDKDNKDKIVGLVTPAQIEKWKQECPLGFYGAKSGKHIAYLRYPTRDEINDALTNMVEGEPFSAYANMANMTFIGGSADLLTNDRLYTTVIHKIKTEIDGNAEILNF